MYRPYSPLKPIAGRVSVSKAIKIPAAAASAEPMPNTHKITLSELMPIMLLNSGLLATARI